MKPYVLICLLVTACSQSAPLHGASGPVGRNDIRLSDAQLNADQAQSDARAAVSRGDKYLICVYGYSEEVPGVPEERVPVGWTHGSKCVYGTSDYQRNKREVRFNDRAAIYAAAYNKEVLAIVGAPPGGSSK